jgi:hypothetical protein
LDGGQSGSKIDNERLSRTSATAWWVIKGNSLRLGQRSFSGRRRNHSSPAAQKAKALNIRRPVLVFRPDRRLLPQKEGLRRPRDITEPTTYVAGYERFGDRNRFSYVVDLIGMKLRKIAAAFDTHRFQ